MKEFQLLSAKTTKQQHISSQLCPEMATHRDAYSFHSLTAADSTDSVSEVMCHYVIDRLIDLLI